ncbi:C1 family peptidase [Streptomyces sp. NPDC017095]|uniref:C1 family peptidase n=1 Tax=Streptomyces sp. NPDC017095 TaxID=3364977 RepID=UPI0037B13925
MELPPHITREQRYPVTRNLGWHHVLDSRSLDYRVEPADPASLNTVEWTPKVPVLQQDELKKRGIDTAELLGAQEAADGLGACAPYGCTTALSIVLDDDRLAEAGMDTTDPSGGEKFALRWYAAATLMDDLLEKQYPNDDCGTTGIACCKAGHKEGWYDSYHPITSPLALVTALQSGPVVMGTHWYDAFSYPDGDGFIDSGDWDKSPIVGGHTVCVARVEEIGRTPDGDLDPQRTVLALRNSWGPGWGEKGWFRMRLSTYQREIKNMEAYQFRVAPRIIRG